MSKRNVIHSHIAKKHGRRRIIVFETLYERWALDREIELIALLKTQTGILGNWGANLSTGGEGLSNPSPEVRSRMSQAQRTRPTDTLATRQKKSLSAKKLNANLAVRKRKSEQLRSHIRTPEHCARISTVRSKAIDQLDSLGNVVASYDSAKEAEKQTGTHRSKICLVCKGIRPRAGGYCWRYKDQA